jgi:hypothetical protein
MIMEQVVGYEVVSPNDPNKRGLLYFSPEAANAHQEHMNSIIDLYDDPESVVWNKSFWTAKPEPFVTFELVRKS